MDKSLIILFSLCLKSVTDLDGENYCSKEYECCQDISLKMVTRYILYDVNRGEGFNLKRDVYMRMATFMERFAKKANEDWHLVLPPWTKQWHWTTEKEHVSYQWDNFFHVESLQLYSPVIEIDQFYEDYGESVDEVYILQHFPEFYTWSGGVDMDWSEKWSFAECRDHQYWKQDDGTSVFYQGEKQVKAKQVRCISFQGSSQFLESILSSTNARSIMFDRAEITFHLMYGDINYWMCRRSMRFAKHLVTAANNFRDSYLNSSDEEDGTVMPLDWREEHHRRSARGGPYLGVHLRMQDFIHGRPKDVPSLNDSIVQIKKYLIQLNLTTVFVATDMTEEQYEFIRNTLEKDNLKPFRYDTDNDEKQEFKEGGLAIIDQIIASHARFFVGTFDSTFTYRIQEEREIIGFPINTTFNRFCPSSQSEVCLQPTKWLVKYPIEKLTGRL